MAPRRIITLTTDFGLADAYVAIMKGVILAITPDATLVDISHQIGPHDVRQAGYLLWTSYRYFPPDAIHVAVVDPGVGTERRPVAVVAPHGLFVGPDNGIFGRSLADQGAMDATTGRLLEGSAVVLTETRYWHHPVSQTFHGRDIFAPAAAHLALGATLNALGTDLTSLTVGPDEAPKHRDGCIYGSIVHIDRFGNAISNVPATTLPQRAVVQIAGRLLHGLARSYQEDQLVALIGSSGMLEVAARNASAASVLGLQVGDPIVVRTAQ
jgi:S-adenosyl-L-methionine hydrolase (adenosine-forming)